MVFNYTIKDTQGNVTDEFEYSVYNDQRNDALKQIIQKYSKEELVNFVYEFCDAYDFYDELKEYFEKDAMAWRKITK